MYSLGDCGGAKTSLPDPFETGEGSEIPFTTDVYPNPATDELTVTFTTYNSPESDGTTDMNINIYDLLGRVVVSKNHRSNFAKLTLDVSDLDSGYYFIQIDNGNQKTVNKLLIN